MVKLQQPNQPGNHETFDELASFIFSDGMIGQKQREYIEKKLEIKKIHNTLNSLQDQKSDLRLLQTFQSETDSDTKKTFIKKARHFFGESDKNFIENEIKINNIDTKIVELKNQLQSAEYDLKIIAQSLKKEQNKEKKQFIQPAWIVKLEVVNDEIKSLTLELQSTNQLLETAFNKKTLAIQALKSEEEEQTKLQEQLTAIEQQLHIETDHHAKYTKNFIETIRYWFAILTGGLFQSIRYRNELLIIDLSQKNAYLNNLIDKKKTTIQALTKEIKQQNDIIEIQTSKQGKTEAIIQQKQKRLAEIESDGLNLLEEVRKKSDDFFIYLKNRSLVTSIQRFIKNPTPYYLHKLQKRMRQDKGYLEDDSIKKLMTYVGSVYTAVEDTHILCEHEFNLEQQQTENGLLLAKTDQKNPWQQGIDYAETRLLLLQSQYQQLRNQQLQDAQFELNYERADQLQSIFLKEILTGKEQLRQLKQQQKQLEEEYDQQIAQIDNPDSTAGIKKTQAIDDIFAKRFEALEEQIEPFDKQLRNLTPNQVKQIQNCYVGIPELTLDLRANELAINHLINTIETIKANQTPKLIALQQQINQAQETLNNTKQLAQTVTINNDFVLENFDIKPFLQRRECNAVIHAIDTFQKSATNEHLASLIEAINAELHRDSPVMLLHELNKIGRIYPIINATLDAIQKKPPTSEQIKQMILSDCREYIEANQPKTLLFFKPGTPNKLSKQNDLTAIIALKSILKNKRDPINSLARIESFIQSTSLNNTSPAARLIQQASSINEAIQAIYTKEQTNETEKMCFK